MIDIQIDTNPHQVLAIGQSVGQSVSLFQVRVGKFPLGVKIFLMYLQIMIIYHSKIKPDRLSYKNPKLMSLDHLRSIVGSIGPYFFKTLGVFLIAPCGAIWNTLSV